MDGSLILVLNPVACALVLLAVFSVGMSCAFLELHRLLNFRPNPLKDFMETNNNFTQ